MTKPLNIVVMLGGPSAEREVSLRSGAAVASARLPAGAVRTQSRKWRTIIDFARAGGVRRMGNLDAATLTNRSP